MLRLLPFLFLPVVALGQTDPTLYEMEVASGLQTWSREGAVRIRVASERRVGDFPANESSLTVTEIDGMLRAEIESREAGVLVRRVAADGSTLAAYDLARRTVSYSRYANDPARLPADYARRFGAYLRASSRGLETEAVRLWELGRPPYPAPSDVNWITGGVFAEDESTMDAGVTRLLYRTGTRSLAFVAATIDDVTRTSAVSYRAGALGGWDVSLSAPEGTERFTLYGRPEIAGFRTLAGPRVSRV